MFPVFVRTSDHHVVEVCPALVHRSTLLSAIDITDATTPISVPFTFDTLCRLEFDYGEGWFTWMPSGEPALGQAQQDLSAANYLGLQDTPLLKDTKRRVGAGLRRAAALCSASSRGTHRVLDMRDLHTGILSGAGVVSWKGTSNVFELACCPSMPLVYAGCVFTMGRTGEVEPVWCVIQWFNNTFVHVSCHINGSDIRSDPPQTSSWACPHFYSNKVIPLFDHRQFF